MNLNPLQELRCAQLPVQIRILIKQNYQHKVVPEGEKSQPTYPVHTCVCLVGFAPYTSPPPEGYALGLYLGSSKASFRHPSQAPAGADTKPGPPA